MVVYAKILKKKKRTIGIAKLYMLCIWQLPIILLIHKGLMICEMYMGELRKVRGETLIPSSHSGYKHLFGGYC